jgi:hypothetical protein
MSVSKINGVTWSDISKTNGVASADIEKVMGVEAADTLLLDTYTGTTAAYSFRKLRAAYSGNCIRVQNDNGINLDIGFSGGYLDTAAIATHCGSGDGKIVTWYDQSSSGANVTQSSASAMPIIFSSGSMNNVNGKAAASFDGGDRLRSSSAFDLHAGTYYATSVVSIGSSVPNAQILSQDDSAAGSTSRIAQYIRLASTARLIAFLTTGSVVQDRGNVPGTNSQQQISTIALSSSLEAFVDSASNGSTSYSGSLRNGSDEVSVGSSNRSTTASDLFTGDIQEIILWDGDQSSNRSLIESAVDTYYSIT